MASPSNMLYILQQVPSNISATHYQPKYYIPENRNVYITTAEAANLFRHLIRSSIAS